MTLQVLAEQLSEAGVPVFLADANGDLTGMATPAEGGGRLGERMAGLGQDREGAAYPVELLNLGGHGPGSPVRASITSSGPALLSRVLWLRTQESGLAQAAAGARARQRQRSALDKEPAECPALHRHRPRPGDHPLDLRHRATVLN